MGHDGGKCRPARMSGDPALRHVLQKATVIRGLGCALALTVSVFALSGCVTAAKDTAEAATAADQAVPETASAEVENSSPGTYQDPRVSAVGADGQPQTGHPATENAMAPTATDGQPASLTLQGTGLNATSSSIFAVQTPHALPAQDAQAEPGTAPLPVAQETGVNPASNSLFNSGQPAAQPVPLPLEEAGNAAGTPAAVQMASAQTDADGNALPVAVPVPTSALAIRAETAPQPAVGDTAAIAVADGATAPDSSEGTGNDTAKKSLTLAGLFAAKRRNRNQFDGDRFAQSQKKKTLVAARPQNQVAALGFAALPGVRTGSMFATADDSQPGHDDQSGAIELASLPGLARLAPNGLLLQTERVETGCFQPELMQVLKTIETHYGRKIMVTSGLRDLKHNRRAGGRRGSLHTTCEAADIQVPGVSKWELAGYLRTIPGRGGVGTYCHTESVHIDTGEARDWNWRCRRRKSK